MFESFTNAVQTFLKTVLPKFRSYHYFLVSKLNNSDSRVCLILNDMTAFFWHLFAFYLSKFLLKKRRNDTDNKMSSKLFKTCITLITISKMTMIGSYDLRWWSKDIDDDFSEPKASSRRKMVKPRVRENKSLRSGKYSSELQSLRLKFKWDVGKI